tara:strand:+ start:5239 stop:6117 length:879 start_codon:yes stop_codon:yes gene_type:complete
MIKSMTGYSRKERVVYGHRVVVEIRSTNHRFCEITTHLPSTLSPHEAKIKRIIGQHVSRGKVDVSISIRNGSRQQQHIRIDEDIARQYICALKKVQRDLCLTGDIDISLLANFRELTTIAPPPIPTEVVMEIMDRVLRSALEELDLMRHREGRALTRDILSHLRGIRRDITAIKRRAPRIIQHYTNRLHKKITPLMKDYTVDAARLSQEIALFATRCDISEELVRTDSHLDQCQALIETGTEVGKTLNFLMQELNREVNTMGTKGNDLDVSQRTVAIKGRLEKIREQIHNLE